jgi:hypothetical protein
VHWPGVEDSAAPKALEDPNVAYGALVIFAEESKETVIYEMNE